MGFQQVSLLMVQKSGPKNPVDMVYLSYDLRAETYTP